MELKIANILRGLEVPFASRKGWNFRKREEEPATPILCYPKRSVVERASDAYPRARTIRGLWAASWRSWGRKTLQSLSPSSPSSSPSSSLSSNLKMLGPNLPDVSPNSSAFRSQSSADGQIANVIKACEEVGTATYVEESPEECTEDEVLHVVSRSNNNPSVNACGEERIINFVSPEKEVDGFHPLNTGNLTMKGREPLCIPCAPKSCIELLLRFGVEIMGKRAVVVRRSKIVGLPTSFLLQRHHTTVSTVHSFAKNPEQITSEADIVIADVGIPNLICGSWLKPGAVVVDMGTNQVQDPGIDRGFHITRDVCYEEAIKVVSAVTPVPGGVGPVTIAMLLSNPLDSAKRAFGFI